jgi:hypothetical protein
VPPFLPVLGVGCCDRDVAYAGVKPHVHDLVLVALFLVS